MTIIIIILKIQNRCSSLTGSEIEIRYSLDLMIVDNRKDGGV